MSDTPDEVLEELKGVFEAKNADYGNSWQKVGVLKRVMADKSGPDVVWVAGDTVYESADEAPSYAIEAVFLVDTPENNSTFEQNADDLITRLLDKLVRAYNLVFLQDEPALDNESTEDAAKDLCGYSSMLTSMIRGAK